MGTSGGPAPGSALSALGTVPITTPARTVMAKTCGFFSLNSSLIHLLGVLLQPNHRPPSFHHASRPFLPPTHQTAAETAECRSLPLRRFSRSPPPSRNTRQPWSLGVLLSAHTYPLPRSCFASDLLWSISALLRLSSVGTTPFCSVRHPKRTSMPHIASPLLGNLFHALTRPTSFSVDHRLLEGETSSVSISELST